MADTCAQLSSEIAALRVEIGRLENRFIPRTQEAAIINTAKVQAKDLIMPLVIAYVLGQLKPVVELVSKIEGTLFALSGQITNFIARLSAIELSVINALKTAANALGISNAALKAVGELFAKLSPLLSILGTILSLVEAIATLETLGARINAVENAVVRLGDDISGILGKLLGLQNRISRNEASISEVRGIALDAKSIGEAARLQAGAAQVTATRAEAIGNTADNKADQAQLTADGALRNANTANENAKTAFQKATEATTIANQATSEANKATKTANNANNKAGQAFNKALEALGIALTALSLYQAFKGLKGLQGPPGRDGRPGRDGAQGRTGFDGRPGVNGIPGTVGAQGIPGRNGTPGINGTPGRNGVDAVPYNDASLRAFIAGQHTKTQARVNATTVAGTVATTGAIASFRAAFVAQWATYMTRFIGFAKWLQLDRILNVMIWANTLHNAYMLSSNLGQTLFSIVDNIAGIFLSDDEGNDFSASTIIGQTIDSAAKSLLGVQTWEGIKTAWKKYNRIYQAAANMFNTLTSMFNSLYSILEIIGNRISRIANALRWAGAIADDAYAWMNENNNFNNPVIVQLTELNEAADSLDMVSGEILNVKTQGKELKANKEEFNKAVADLETKEVKKETAERDKIKVDEPVIKDVE